MEKSRNIYYVCFLAMVAALGGFLFGYDTAVISGTISRVSAQFGLGTMEQGWYVGCALVGSIAGVLVAGWLSDRYGRKKMMLLSAVLFSLSAIGCALSGTFTTLVIYRIIGGVGIGVVSIVSPMYISEVALSHIRGSLVALYQLAITVGFLGAYLVNFKILGIAQAGKYGGSGWTERLWEEEWRAMLGTEAFPAVLFLVIIIFIPESPRWLVMQGMTLRARHIFSRIVQSDEQAIVMTGEIQKGETSRSLAASLKILANPKILLPVFLGVALAMLGQFMGVNAVLYYGPSIFEQSGLSGGDALYYQVWVGLVNVLTTVLALCIIDRVGRKKLVYFGVTGMIGALLCISLYFYKGEAWQISSGILLGLFLFYVFATAISISAVIFVLLSEMYPNSIRGLAMSLAGLSLWVGTYLVGQLTPWLLETLRPAGTFLFFGIMCLPYLYLMWKYIPETARKSLEDIEAYWMKK
ncbi:MFS transporter, sugar porter (SP) family [Sinomicrobium oceani]|uniref:MFS transporter, sugar porter (SP) family n=1 Tax=Sinomicrobium oceani TaxID=1150368 RepID=A0A1K1Q380_9FLAO|nr:sugar porter family MFS transporter [Sinomicrobium oceani]SFW54367.1 MFS transporter, sugar porter (SP) family [Sinomicrobium oceani]